MVANGILNRLPDFKFLVPQSRTRKILPAFSVDEVADVLKSIDRTTAIGKRNYAIILLAVTTGIRAGDILNLKFGDIDFENYNVCIIQEKTDKWLKTSVSEQICNAVADYILDGLPKTESRHIFVNQRVPFGQMRVSMLTKLMDRQCEKAGVEKKKGRSFHGLRRTFATSLANEGVDITLIAQMLGQRKPNSSKVYMSFNNIEISKCAMDFSDIPIKGGIYHELGRKA
jgi:integrase